MQLLNKQLGIARLTYQFKANKDTQGALKGCRWLFVMARDNLSEKIDGTIFGDEPANVLTQKLKAAITASSIK